jgi:RNA polymerase sigma-B factor
MVMPLAHLEDGRLARLAVQAHTEARARDVLVRALMPMAERVGRRFASVHHPAEDLAQVAGIGLLKAIERFDLAREAAFTTYAYALMTGEVRRHLRDSRLVRVPRPIYEQVPRYRRAHERLSAELGRTPTRDELADVLGVTKDEVTEIGAAAVAAQPLSLDASLEENGGEVEIPHVDDGFERVEDGVALAPLLRSLTSTERIILSLHYNDGLSQAQIGEDLGISQMQVSRLLRGALAKLSERALAEVA